MMIANDHCISIKRREFKLIYKKATEEPFQFMCLDKTAKHVPEMYRKIFDGFYKA